METVIAITKIKQPLGKLTHYESHFSLLKWIGKPFWFGY